MARRDLVKVKSMKVLTMYFGVQQAKRRRKMGSNNQLHLPLINLKQVLPKRRALTIKKIFFRIVSKIDSIL
jgi:hypothetical protein